MTSFPGLFGRDAEVAWWAPGRVNLIGEHTDYNGGFVLPMAVPLGVRATAAARGDDVLRIASAQRPGDLVEVRLDGLVPGTVTGWAAYVAGAAWALREAGVTLPGADLLLDGDVPTGSGLSSSAAVECASACALLSLADVVLDPLRIARLAQRAENDFVGMPCGLMDQAASMLCRAGHLLLLDCRDLSVAHVPFDPGAAGLALLVTDTRAPHRLVDGEYAARRADGETAARALGVPALRDVDPGRLEAALSSLDADVLRRRVRHVVTEDVRVLEVVSLLRAGRLAEIGPLLTASHASLRDDYEVSCPELDLAVEAALAAGALGARMTGGGFGGSTLALVPAALARGVAQSVADAFAVAGFAAPVSRVMAPAAGATAVPF